MKQDSGFDLTHSIKNIIYVEKSNFIIGKKYPSIHCIN